ncbi:MAG: chemotaxis protein CheA [Spirochaetaceae bacterium]|jgi:two-component system chemotaxis sensor kinase CheA|nr:chemotaxis protein CheA [Spirochaetaceae bacterium]
MSDYLDPNNEELLKDFFIEANLQVELLEQNILAIENDPGDGDAVDEIFRAAHTLKGGAATVQMTELAEFTHIVEDLLDEIRSGNVGIEGDVVDGLLSSIDVVKAMLEARSEGYVYDEDITDIKNQLKAALDKKASPPPKKEGQVSTPAAKVSSTEIPSSDSRLSEYEILELFEAAGSGNPVIKVSVSFDENNPMNSVGGIQVYAALKSAGILLKTVPDFEALYEDTYYPVVDYFLSTDLTENELVKKASISEVTTTISVNLVSNPAETPPATQPKSKVVNVPAAAPIMEDKDTPISVPAPVPKPIEDDSPQSEEVLKKTRPKTKGRDKVVGSILRVDSKRIDNLLNLVSEAVINKATFNQINIQFTDCLNVLQSVESEYKEKVKSLFESIPEYLEEYRGTDNIKEIKKDINNRFGDLTILFDGFEDSIKSAVNQFKSTAANLARNTGDLHEGILRIRMVQINQIFSRFPRLVRDMSKKLGKNINLEILGEDTELDKSVIEELLDPLMHCVRNSLDHGIESPEVRAGANKKEDGQILLSARNEGNLIVIEISDDGAGIDVEVVREKAIKRGVIHQSKNLSDLEAYNLIFEPGFSTAKTVTDISGRGVGLDVVRKQIEKLNGNVTVWSEKGVGSTFTIRLPLTLAIIQGLLVRVGSEVYAIPITSVAESHRVKQESINMIDGYEVFNVRNEVISLMRLGNIFRIPSTTETEYKFIVIVGSGDKKMGLMVDSLIGEEDVVIKPLLDKYTNSPGIAGATILGDGTVSLIIDVAQLLDLGVKKEQADRLARSTVVYS